MATATEIGGISVTISANTGPLDRAIETAESKLASLSSSAVVTIEAQVSTASIDSAVASAKAKIRAVGRASKAEPVPINFVFGDTAPAVKRLRQSFHRELLKQGGIETSVKPMKGAEAALKESIADFNIVVPVAFVWNGKFEGGTPTVEVNANVKGNGKQTQTQTAGSGGSQPVHVTNTPLPVTIHGGAPGPQHPGGPPPPPPPGGPGGPMGPSAGFFRGKPPPTPPTESFGARMARLAREKKEAQAAADKITAEAAATKAAATSTAAGTTAAATPVASTAPTAKPTAAPTAAKAAEPVATPPVEPLLKSAGQVGPSSTATTMVRCPNAKCPGSYEAGGQGWNRHQQSSEHRNAVAKTPKKDAAGTGAGYEWDLGKGGQEVQERQQASVLSGRGIYPQGSTIMEQQRAGEAESRDVPSAGRMFQQYIAAGGDVRAARRGQPGPLPGREEEFSTAFPGVGTRESVLSRKQIKEELAQRSARLREQEKIQLLARGSYAGEFTVSPAVERKAKLFGMVTRIGARRAGLNPDEIPGLAPSEEFLGIREHFRERYSPSGERLAGYAIDYPPEYAQKLQTVLGMTQEGMEMAEQPELSAEQLQEIHEKHPESDEAFEKAVAKARKKLPYNEQEQQAGLAEAIGAGYQLRRDIGENISRRAVRSAERKAGRKRAAGEEVPADFTTRAAAKGSRRIKRQTTKSGRKIAQNIRNVEDVAILHTQAAIDLAKTMPGVRAEDVASSEIAKTGQESREFNEKLGVAPTATLQTTSGDDLKKIDAKLAKIPDRLELIEGRMNVLADAINEGIVTGTQGEITSSEGGKLSDAIIKNTDALEQLTTQRNKLLAEQEVLEKQKTALVTAAPGEPTPVQAKPAGKVNPSAKPPISREAARAQGAGRIARKSADTTQILTPEGQMDVAAVRADVEGKKNVRIAADEALVAGSVMGGEEPLDPEEAARRQKQARMGAETRERLAADRAARERRVNLYLLERRKRMRGPVAGSEQPAGGRIPPGAPQFSAGTTGGEPLEIDKIIKENADLRHAARLASTARSERARHAANVRWERVRAEKAAGPTASEPEEPAAAAEPIRTKKGTRAERKARAEGAGTRRRAGGIDAATMEPVDEGDESIFQQGFISQAKIKTLLGEDVVGQIRQQVEEGTQDTLAESAKLKRSARSVLEENPVRALSVAISQIAVNVAGGRAKLKRDIEIAEREGARYDQSIKKTAAIYERVLQTEAALAVAKEQKDKKSQVQLQKQLTALRGAEADPTVTKEIEQRQEAVTELGKRIFDAREKGHRQQARVLRLEQDQARDQIKELQKRQYTSGRLGDAIRIEDERRVEAREATREVTRRRVPQALATIGVGTVGVVAGTALFQGAMAIFNAALEQASIGLGRVAAAATDYEQRTGELTSGLADTARANSGNVEAAVASSFAMAGFGKETADSIRPLIELRTSVHAGTKAFEEQVDFMRAARFIEQGVTEGPEGQRVDAAGVFETTGGFPLFGARPGGQRSVAELLGEQFASINQDRSKAFASLKPIVDVQTPVGQLQLGTPSAETQAKAANTFLEAAQATEDVVAHVNEDIERGGLTQLRLTAAPTDTESAALAKAAKEAAAALPEQAEEITNFTNRLTEAGVGITGGVTAANLPLMLQSLATGALIPSAEDLAAQQQRPLMAALQQRQIQGVQQREVLAPAQEFLGQLAQPLVPFEETVAARTPGAQDASNYKEAKASIDAAHESLRGYAAEGEKAALQAVRFADAHAGGNLTSQWTQATSALRAYGKEISALQISMNWKQVNLQVAQYDEQLRVANRSLADAREFLTGIDQSGNHNLGLLERQARIYSQQSAEIGFQQAALGQQSAELGLQNQLLGIKSKELSLQTAQLSRQSQQLGFQAQANQLAMNQRQINFQQAMAGFSAPGTTFEERAARVEQAKAEATFAQKQQDIAMDQFDIAKEIFGLEGQQLQISVATLELDRASYEIQVAQVGLANQALGISRAAYEVQQAIIDVNAVQAVEDLEHQIRLLTRARTVTIELAIDAERLQALQRAQAKEMDKAQDVLSEAVDIRNQIIASQVQIAAALGGAVSIYAAAVLNSLATGFSEINTFATTSINRINAVLSGDVTSPGGTKKAEGFYGSFSSPTQLTVGEAGSETVAILRNPRHMMFGPGSGSGGGGGGGNYVQINVTGNTVRNDEDLEMLSTLVARKVQEGLGREASVRGFRVAR